MTKSLESFIKSLFTYKISDTAEALLSHHQAHTANTKCIDQILLLRKQILMHVSGIFLM